MNRSILTLFLILAVSFLMYSIIIYFNLGNNKQMRIRNSEAAEGKMVWQKYNCQSCHQLYGLGGYLGPDLTNVYSKHHKNEIVLKALINSGNERMPSYQLNTKELTALMAFFKTFDETGVADPRTFEMSPSGMIYKK